MQNRTDLEKKIKKELEACILLSEEGKIEFLQKIPQMPDFLLKKSLLLIQEKNSQANNYIAVALDNDPEQKYLQQVDTYAKKSKKEATEIYDQSNRDQADQALQNQLENISHG